MKRFIVLLLAFVLVIQFTVPVYAAAPVIETGSFESTYAFEPPPCADFVVMNHEVVAYHQVTYFDQQGNIERVRVHFTGSDNFYNDENPDKVLSGKFSGSAEVDLETGEFVFGSGLTIHITEPGYGIVFRRVGRWLVYPDYQLGGKNSLLIPEDVEQFCSLLASN